MMPLVQGKSNKARSENIATEIRSGRDPKQAAAIAYSVQRRNMGKKYGDANVRSNEEDHEFGDKPHQYRGADIDLDSRRGKAPYGNSKQGEARAGRMGRPVSAGGGPIAELRGFTFHDADMRSDEGGKGPTPRPTLAGHVGHGEEADGEEGTGEEEGERHSAMHHAMHAAMRAHASGDGHGFFRAIHAGLKAHGDEFDDGKTGEEERPEGEGEEEDPEEAKEPYGH